MMPREVVDALCRAMLGRTCKSAMLLHGYPWFDFGDGRTIRLQSRWRMGALDGGKNLPSPPDVQGLVLTGLEIVGERSDLRLTWDDAIVLETQPEGEDLQYETWEAQVAPRRVAGGGPGTAWFSSLDTHEED